MRTSRVYTDRALSSALKRLRAQHKRIVFTNGCFDILHAGHIDYLTRARRLGDALVIGLNSDRSVKRIKGPGRPVNRQADRARVMAALGCVDLVTIFDESTPERLIRQVRPDILVKGGDWKVRDIVGGEFVRERGGRVVSVPYLKGYSTTGLLRKMAAAKCLPK